MNIIHGNEFMILYSRQGTRLCRQPTAYTAPTYQHHLNMSGTYSMVLGTVPGTTLVCPYIAYKNAWHALIGPSTRYIPGYRPNVPNNMTFIGCRRVVGL